VLQHQHAMLSYSCNLQASAQLGTSHQLQYTLHVGPAHCCWCIVVMSIMTCMSFTYVGPSGIAKHDAKAVWDHPILPYQHALWCQNQTAIFGDRTQRCVHALCCTSIYHERRAVPDCGHRNALRALQDLQLPCTSSAKWSCFLTTATGSTVS
jgi:hypothetical protein